MGGGGRDGTPMGGLSLAESFQIVRKCLQEQKEVKTQDKAELLKSIGVIAIENCQCVHTR